MSLRTVSSTIFLKKFNNFIKAAQIREITFGKRNMSILDMCCGAGGDLFKWQKANIAHYVGSDLSSSSVREAKKRHEEMC